MKNMAWFGGLWKLAPAECNIAHHVSCSVLENKCMLKVNNRKGSKRCKICSKLTKKDTWATSLTCLNM